MFRKGPYALALRCSSTMTDITITPSTSWQRNTARRNAFRDLLMDPNHGVKPRTGRFTLNDLDEDFALCRFMSGERFYCGSPVDHGPFCNAHARVVYR